MDVTVTNISAAAVGISDLYTTIPVGGSVSFKRSAAQLSAMVSLQKAAADGLVTVAATMESFETASGLAAAPNSIEAADIAAVSATVAASGEIKIRKNFTTTASTDIVVYAANALPYKIRILDAYLLISTVQVGSSAQLFDQAAGAGNAITTSTSTATAGRIPMVLTGNASQVVTPGTLVGLFLRPSAHTGVVGELVIEARRET